MDAPKQLAARKTGFASLGLGEDLMAAVAEHRFEAPTEIQVHPTHLSTTDKLLWQAIICGHHPQSIFLLQSAAIPEILKGGDLLLASHTGSGKTLAYLLPLVRLQSSFLLLLS